MKCKRPTCELPARPGDNGFCRKHYNAFLKARAQVEGWPLGRVDTAPAIEHLGKLRAAGLGLPRIAALSGLDCRNLQELHRRKTCYGSTAAKLLRVPVPEVLHRSAAAGAVVPSIGTVRRLRALVALGYTCRQLGGFLGSTTTVVSNMTLGHKRFTFAEFAQRVDDLFRELEMTPAPPSLGATRSRNRARAKGWAPPLDWPEGAIDDPNAIPDTADGDHAVPRIEQYRELKSLGYPEERIAEKMGIKHSSLKMLLTRAA